MSRLWIRFSIIISTFAIVITLLWIGSEFLFDDNRVTISRNGVSFNNNFRIHDLPEEIAEITVLISSISIALGVWLSRGLSAPIVTLSAAAKQIGSGNLQQRVPVLNHSQELDDLAESFNRMAADLEHSERLRNNMLADISHELRTPLTVLSGQLHAALDKVVELDEEGLANLYGQTQHLIRLVEDLRLLAQAEAQQLPLAMTQVNLADVWRELAANFSLIAEEKEIRFRVEPMDNLPLVSADPGRLRQVFSNLLANGIRHTPAGGEIIVSSQIDDQYVIIKIRDTGEGITADQLPHLFNRFYRADGSRSRDTGGSGLGLPIAKALIEAHQGTISAESAGPNKGSTFAVSLPIQQTEPT